MLYFHLLVNKTLNVSDMMNGRWEISANNVQPPLMLTLHFYAHMIMGGYELMMICNYPDSEQILGPVWLTCCYTWQ